jgi:hypothetical protein
VSNSERVFLLYRARAAASSCQMRIHKRLINRSKSISSCAPQFEAPQKAIYRRPDNLPNFSPALQRASHFQARNYGIQLSHVQHAPPRADLALSTTHFRPLFSTTCSSPALRAPGATTSSTSPPTIIPVGRAGPSWHGPGPCQARAILTGPQPVPTSKRGVPCCSTGRQSGPGTVHGLLNGSCRA